MSSTSGVVYLVGGGPGDPGLITVRGLALLRRADVVVHDRLTSRELLSEVPDGAEVINITELAPTHRERQTLVNDLLIDRARKGLRVVRLKGGDPFVFGRGYEELQLCREAGVTCAMVPGITSAIAAPVAAGIPVTARRLVRSFAVMTAAVASDSEAPPVDYEALSRLDTIIVMMGRSHLEEVCRELRAAGLDEQTPVACVANATTPQQRVTKGTLATIVEAVERDGLRSPMTAVIGAAAELADPHASPTMLGWNRGPEHTALLGKRVLITRPMSCVQGLVDALYAAGATPIAWRLSEIEYSSDVPEVDQAIHELPQFDWLVFNSKSGVHGWWRRLREMGLDARAVGFCRIGASGKSTLKSLERIGLVPDVACEKDDPAGLTEAMVRGAERAPGRVLFPCGGGVGEPLVDALSKAGSLVTAPVVYRSVPAALPSGSDEVLRAGIDAVVFYSASGVTHFTGHRLDVGNAAIVCIGEASANAARNAGLSVVVTSATATVDDLVDALAQHFTVRV